MSFVTLKKSDDQFLSYLEGSFSKTERALPQKSLYINTPQEQVTFKIVPTAELVQPHWFILFLKLFRWDSLSLSLGPALATYAYLISQKMVVNHFFAIMAIIAVLLLHTAVFALNDYKDHIVGVDRFNFLGGSQVIQLGWMTAYRVRELGIGLLILGSLLGGYLVLQQPVHLILVAFLVALFVIVNSFRGKGLKYLGFSEFFSFLCFGSFLTYGFSRAASFHHSLPIIILGIPFGYLATLTFLLRQLQNIVSDIHIGITTLVGKFGFDKAKWILQTLFAIFPLICLGIFYALHLNVRAYFLVVPISYFCIRLGRSIHRLQSSFSSGIEVLKSKALDFHIFFSTVMVLAVWV